MPSRRICILSYIVTYFVADGAPRLKTSPVFGLPTGQQMIDLALAVLALEGIDRSHDVHAYLYVYTIP